MKCITVENTRIRVTVSNDIWESYRKSANHQSRMTGVECETVMRGLVLSSAMNKLGNASEAELIKGVEVTDQEVLEAAKKLLIVEHLENNSCAKDVVMRFLGGHRLSPRMVEDVALATAYAESQLSSLQSHDKTDLACSLFADEQQNSRRKQKLFETRTQPVTKEGERALNEARESLQGLLDNEKWYRQKFANQEGWQIEVIGTMPEIIGMCRYQLQQAATGS